MLYEVITEKSAPWGKNLKYESDNSQRRLFEAAD